MASFLSLPTEIRTIILECAVNSPQAPPRDPWTGEEQRKPCRGVDYDSWAFGLKHTLYPPTPRLLPPASYQLVNRQLHDETRELLRRTTRPRYDLDVMVIHDWDFWPTWTNVPTWRTHANNVNVTFRLFGHCALPAWLRSITGDGGSPGIEWCFYALLERFVALGPINQLPTNPDSSTTQRKSEGRFFTHTLILNVESSADNKYPISPPEVTYSDYREYNRASRHRMSASVDLSTYAMRPEWFARNLCNEIAYALDMSYHTLYLVGGILYEHIGMIRVLVEGKMFQEFDLAKKLAPMKWECQTATMSRAERREYFWRWKRDAQRTRARLGFPVIAMKDNEFDEYPE